VQVSAIGSGNVQGSSNTSQATISGLERQRDKVLKQIRDLTTDTTKDANTKQMEQAVYQAQLQLIEAQIAALRTQQAEAAAKAAEGKEGGGKGAGQGVQAAAPSAPQQAAAGDGSLHVVA
jgi:hypothetical protein